MRLLIKLQKQKKSHSPQSIFGLTFSILPSLAKKQLLKSATLIQTFYTFTKKSQGSKIGQYLSAYST